MKSRLTSKPLHVPGKRPAADRFSISSCHLWGIADVASVAQLFTSLARLADLVRTTVVSRLSSLIARGRGPWVLHSLASSMLLCSQLCTSRDLLPHSARARSAWPSWFDEHFQVPQGSPHIAHECFQNFAEEGGCLPSSMLAMCKALCRLTRGFNQE